MTDKLVRVKLVSGEPLLGKAEIDNTFDVELLVPGVADGRVRISACENEMVVELPEDEAYTNAFEVAFSSEYVDFRDYSTEKVNGILYISCRVKEENEDESFEIYV